MALIAACAPDRATRADADGPLSLVVVSGGDQRGVVGEPLPLAFRIRLTRGGQPVSGEMLAGQVVAGGGQLLTPTVMTDRDGRAALVLTLGTRAGEPQQVAVRYVDPSTGLISTLATISAGAQAGAPASLVPLAPTRQRAILGAPVDSAPAVRVLDRYGNPVVGARVAFTTPSTGVALSDTVAIVDSLGVARIERWALLQPSPRSELVVRAAGSNASVTFVASAFADIDLAMLPPLPRVASGWNHTCALNERGRVYCWGANLYGVIGLPSFGTGGMSKSAVPRLVDSTRTYTAVVGGDDFACALEEGSGQVFCWGSNKHGQLGTTTAVVNYADYPIPLAVELPEPLVRISGGGQTVCGITGSGVAYCWGNTSDGQVGYGRVNGVRRTPVQAALGLRFADISVGWLHTCGLRKDGSVYCWGSNEHFQLGWPSSTPRVASAVPLYELPQVLSIAAGRVHTCAILADSTSACWGGNFDGQFGDGTGWASRDPVITLGGNKFRQLVAGEGHTCGLRMDKRVLCWGVNDDASLGDGTFITKVEPTPLSGARNYTSLARRCATADDKSLWCWGPNAFWQTSFGAAATPRATPVRVPLP